MVLDDKILPYKLQFDSWHTSAFGTVNVVGHNERYARSFCLCRSRCTTMLDNAFVILEDGTAPTRFDVLQNFGEDVMYETPHFRQTHMTCNPPGALEALLDQLQARWVSTRGHSQPSGAPQSLQDSGPQLTIIGQVFAVGTDWIVRAGTVQLSGGAMKGMLLEECILPDIQSAAKI